MTTKKLDGQVAVITGANSGIGRGIALAMGAAGAKVVVNYYANPDAATEVVDAIKASGSDAIAHQTDVSKEDQVKGLFQAAIDAFGTVDILVNNAGIQVDVAFDEMSVDQWNRVIAVNLTGAFICAREAVREFKRRGMRDVSKALGKIIFISSVHELIPWAGHVNYAASKGGIMLMMKSVAQELGYLKIRVNSISPGAIRTPINKETWGNPASYEKLMELIPFNRIGETHDVADSAVWLASDEADYIHGISLFVDGGMTLYPGFIDNG